MLFDDYMDDSDILDDFDSSGDHSEADSEMEEADCTETKMDPMSLSIEGLARRFKLSEANAEKIRSNFSSHDNDNSGTVNVDELGHILEDMGVTIDHEKLELVLADIDADNSGELDLLEFFDMMIRCGGVEQDEFDLARKTFERHDSDHSGTIDREEFRSCCRELMPTLSEKDIRNLLKASDMDEDGLISFQEFLQCIGLKSQEEVEMDRQQKMRRGEDTLSVEEKYAHFVLWLKGINEYDRTKHHLRQEKIYDQYSSSTRRFPRDITSGSLSNSEKFKIISNDLSFHHAIRGEMDIAQVPLTMDTRLARANLESYASSRMSTTQVFQSILCACSARVRTCDGVNQ